MTEIHPLLNKERQKLARRYEKEKRILGLASMTLSFIILLAFYISGLSLRLATAFAQRAVVWAFLIYVPSCLGIWAVLSIPLSFYIGLISAVIAVFNFLPLPPLDGGLVVLLLIEKIRGTPLSERVLTIIAYTGWFLILALLLYVTYNDIVRNIPWLT